MNDTNKLQRWFRRNFRGLWLSASFRRLWVSLTVTSFGAHSNACSNAAAIFVNCRSNR